MKPTIQDTNYIVLHGWIVNRLGLTSEEALVYALIYGYKDGFDQPVAYIAQWIGKTDITIRKILQHLVQEGFITKTTRIGKPTIYTCTPIKTYGVKNLPPIKNDTPTPIKTYGVNINNNNIILSSSNNACAHARERLKKWVQKSDLKEWADRMLRRNNISVELEVLIDDFFDNDFKVRERCEQNNRIDVLTHFQNWLPKYINKLKYQNDNANPTTHRPSAPQAGGTSRTGNSTSLDDIARSIAAGFAAGAARRE